MNRLYLAGGALLVILVLSFTSCTLYKSKVAASVKADTLAQVVTEAVAESKAEARSAYQAQSKKAVALDSVRPKYAIAREKYVPKPDPSPDADAWLGVFNDAVRTSNGAIESASGVSGAM